MWITDLSTVLEVKSDVIYYDRFCIRQIDSGLSGRLKRPELSFEDFRTSSDKKKT